MPEVVRGLPSHALGFLESISGSEWIHSPIAMDALTERNCPRCGGSAPARGVELANRRHTITYECDGCHHRWSLTSAAPLSRTSAPRRDAAGSDDRQG